MSSQALGTARANVHRPRLYSAAQVRELDRRAIEELGIRGYELMQRAAAASFEALQRQWPQARHVAVLCGSGNNGGDGYEVARLALAAGSSVQVIDLAKRRPLLARRLLERGERARRLQISSFSSHASVSTLSRNAWLADIIAIGP